MSADLRPLGAEPVRVEVIFRKAGPFATSRARSVLVIVELSSVCGLRPSGQEEDEHPLVSQVIFLRELWSCCCLRRGSCSVLETHF